MNQLMAPMVMIVGIAGSTQAGLIMVQRTKIRADRPMGTGDGGLPGRDMGRSVVASTCLMVTQVTLKSEGKVPTGYIQTEAFEG